MFAAFFRQVKVDDLSELNQPSLVSYLEARNHLKDVLTAWAWPGTIAMTVGRICAHAIS